MTRADISAVLRPVRRAERRLRAARALRVSAVALTFALAVAVIVVALRKLGVLGEVRARVVLGLVVAAWGVTTIVAYLRRLAPRSGSVALDRHHKLADRLSSALDFAARPAAEVTPFMEAAIDDAIAHAAKLDPRAAVPIPLPRELAFAGGLLGLFVATTLFEVRTREVVARAATLDALDVTTDDVDAVREFLKELEQKPLADDTKAAIAELNQLLDDLSQKRLDRTDAFRKIKALEDKLMNGREASSKELDEALAKMGEELKKTDLSKAAGEALAKQDLAGAAERLKELAKKLREGKDKAVDKAQLERLRDAFKKASESQADRKASLDKRREELKSDLLKRKERLGDGGADEERSLLKKKERELERLEREREQAEKTSRQLDRLDRELSKAAEDLLRDLGASADDLDNSAEDINRMARDKMSNEEKEQLRQRLQELREALRQQQGQGGKQLARLQRFQNAARGSRRGGSPQGQSGQSQGQGQEGQGQPGGQGDEQGNEQGQGQGQDGQGGQSGQGKNGETWVLGPGGQKMLMLSKGRGQSGQGGSESGRGSGAGKDPGGPLKGQATNLPGQTQDTQVAGQDTGQGSSRSEVILGAAERGFTSRGYKNVYREYKTVAEEALQHDELPGGYRFYVRRYFMLIRPRENP